MINRRHFSNISLPEMNKKIDELNDIVGSSLKPGEKVDIEAVAAKVVAKNDPVLSSAFEKVRSQISMIEGPVQANGTVDTQGHEAKNAFSMFIDAKAALANIDTNNDQSISRSEVLRSRLAPGAGSTGKDLAEAAIYGSNKEMEERVVAFLEGNAIVADEMSARKAVYSALRHHVKQTVSTPLGQKAVTAHLQKLLLKQGQSDPGAPNDRMENASSLPHYSRMSSDDARTLVKKTLQSAERNFFKRFFGSPELSDKEVGKMVGNTDLEAYVVDTQKEILTTQKASFEEIWLTGSDIIYDDYTGYDNKGSIWGFRLQNDFYVGTDIDPRTLQGIERDQVSEEQAAINQSAAIAAAAIEVDGVDSAFDKLNTSITSGKASEINAPFFIEVKGEKWVADFTKEQGPWFQKKDTDVEAGFVIEDPQDFVDIMTKKKNATALFMSGRLAVEGDMGLAMKVNVIFS